MDFNKLVNNNGIYLYQDNSFNTISIKLNFLSGMSNRECAIVDVLCSYLMASNQNFKSDDDINERTQELYSLVLDFGNQFYSKQKVVSLYANLISPNVINDDYSEEAFEFIRQMLKEPDFTNEEMLEITKRNMISYAKSDLLNNDIYVSNMYHQKVFYEENREYENSTDIDYISNLINSITLDDLKKQYEYIINNFHSGLVFGNISFEQFNNFVNLMALTPIKKDVDYDRNIIIKDDDIEIERDCEQSYIYVTYDIDNLTYPQLMLLNTIMNSSLGLCYQTLRRKYGLVYNSYAGIIYYLKKLYIYGEIDKNKKEKFLEALDEIVNMLNDKELLDKLIVQAKDEIEANQVTLSEDQNKIIDSLNNYILKLFEGQKITDTYHQVSELTSDDLIKSTKTLKRKNIFMVRSKNDE